LNSSKIVSSSSGAMPGPVSATGGTDYDWSNASHVDRANMRRMLRSVVSHSDGALD
jgi:hypothetical protein